MHFFTKISIQSTTRITDFFVVGKMSVDLIGFVNLVGVAYQDPRAYKFKRFPKG